MTDPRHDVVIIGGGAAGIAVAASLLRRRACLDVAIVDPAQVHCYQPGWTMVGAGVFTPYSTLRSMDTVVPRGTRLLKCRVTAVEPEHNVLMLASGRLVRYKQLIVCPGLQLDWHAIEGLPETLGTNGVTSNYRYDLAPYTWELVRRWRGGNAIFTQPSLPIKCAGAPQKAMYLSCDAWKKAGTLKASRVQFMSAGEALFPVPDYVPELMRYVDSYGIELAFRTTLVAIDGPGRRATFLKQAPDGTRSTSVVNFDMIHVVPPQSAPDFVRRGPLADAVGWVDVERSTLRHRRFENVFALGDVANTPNAKTCAAVRKQAPVVAHNVLANLGLTKGEASYDGYGSCPLTVTRGRIVLAEFLYGGKVAPTFPRWLINGRKASRAAWHLKTEMLPWLYWNAMLKGREWLARPPVST